MTWNLFALTKDPARRIARFSLAASVQAEITTTFQGQEAVFNASAQDEIAFDGKYKPDQGEVLVIAGFDDIDGVEAAIRNPMGCPAIEATTTALQNVKALFTGYVDATGAVTALLQAFDRRKIISTDGISLFHSGDVFKRIEGVGLTIDHQLTAVMKTTSLRFFSFHHVRQIFDMSAYYKEATDGDITEFAGLSMIHTGDAQALIANADSWVRRKVSLIQQSRILETVPMNEIRAVAAEFAIPLKTEVIDGIEKIVLPAQKTELKTVLRFLDEDYYKSPLSKTQFISNSKRPAQQE